MENTFSDIIFFFLILRVTNYLQNYVKQFIYTVLYKKKLYST